MPSQNTFETDVELEWTRQRLIDAVKQQGLDASNMSERVADHYSASKTSQLLFRHVPMALADVSAGWVTGLQGVRSYFDLCRVYWRRTVRIRPGTMKVDPEHMTVDFITEANWEWRNPSRGQPWVEVTQGRLWFDFDFKVLKAEYITISGDDTYFMWRRNSPDVDFPVAPRQEPIEYGKTMDSTNDFFFPGR